MSNNNLDEEKPQMWIFILIAIVAVLLPFAIFGLVYYINIEEIPIFYDKKDVLAYYGSIIGACFTGVITAGGLYYTLNQNYKSITKQREFDKDVMEKQKEQYDKDYNLKLINQKLDTYKEIYLSIEQIINKAVSINHKIGLYEHLNIVDGNILMEDGKITINYKHIADIEELCELSNKFKFMEIFITEDSITNLGDKAFNLLKNVPNTKDKRQDDTINDIDYARYYYDIRTAYVQVAEELKRVSKDIYNNHIAKDTKIKYSK